MQRVSEPNMQTSMNNSNGGSKLPWVILAVIVLVLIVVAVLFREKLLPNNGGMVEGRDQASGYQAVFLTNGQVYFGKFADTSAHYSTLRDIYYLQVTEPALQGSADSAQAPAQQPQLSLVKLGNELHGPVDEMKINRDQILFFEDIKEDGRVMQAIREYQANPPAEDGAAAPQQQAPQAGQPAPQQQAQPQTGQQPTVPQTQQQLSQ